MLGLLPFCPLLLLSHLLKNPVKRIHHMAAGIHVAASRLALFLHCGVDSRGMLRTKGIWWGEKKDTGTGSENRTRGGLCAVAASLPGVEP